MHWSVLTFASLALIAAHLLRLPNRGGWIGSGAAFAAGLATTAMLIKLVAGAAGLGRTTEFDGFVNRAIEIAKQDDAPLILFTGASFSRNAIDDERLTAALRERGYPHRVISLSIEAASIFERDAHLRDFIARSPKLPDIVFVEVSEPFDKRPTFFFNNSKFSARGIEQFTPLVAGKTLRGLAEGGCDGAADCMKNALLVGAHTSLNVLNVGLLSQGKQTALVKVEPSYSALTEPREDMFTDAVATGLSARPDVSPQYGPRWVRAARDNQRTRLLQSDGVRSVAYYFPPVTEASIRAYASGLCLGELSDHTCIVGDDSELLQALPPELWADPGHLMDTGAAVYLNWLANELDTSGILHGMENLRGTAHFDGARSR